MRHESGTQFDLLERKYLEVIAFAHHADRLAPKSDMSQKELVAVPSLKKLAPYR